MTIRVQFAPYALKEGAWDATRQDALFNTVLDTLDPYAPKVRGTILEAQVITPQDYETLYGLTEGSLYQGEMMLDQLLFMRPVPECAQYRSPVAGLYLCGAGTHPGGGMTGATAYNAVREVLADARAGR
jgi:phytoene dehydrogenase-like protein